MNFKEFNFSTEVETKKIMINNKEVKVLQYLPIHKKMDLIQIALQESEEDTGYNPVKLSLLMDVYMVYFYTDIEIDDEDREDVFRLYDILETNDVFNIIAEVIPEQEYEELKDFLTEQKEVWEKYRISLFGKIKDLINNLPSNIEEANKIISNFDPSKFQAVIDFATAANGGRPISQNNKTLISQDS